MYLVECRSVAKRATDSGCLALERSTEKKPGRGPVDVCYLNYNLHVPCAV